MTAVGDVEEERLELSLAARLLPAESPASVRAVQE